MDDINGYFEDQNAADYLTIPEPKLSDEVIDVPISETGASSNAAPPKEETFETQKDSLGAAENISPKEAKCYALMGSGGGTGVTSLCIQLAYDLTKRAKKNVNFWKHMDPTVCLIDLDFESGSCASYLNVQPSLAVSDVCGPASRIDSSSLQGLVSHDENGLAVLSTPNVLGANSSANPETVLAILDAASQIYEHVIIDLPKMWLPWVAAIIAGADHFALVSELNVASLHAARVRIADIEEKLGQDQKCEVILNKVERRSFRNSIRLADAEKALHRDLTAAICVDVDLIREAINCGVAAEIIRPEARYVKDAAKLSRLWSPEQVKPSLRRKDRRRKTRSA